MRNLIVLCAVLELARAAPAQASYLQQIALYGGTSTDVITLGVTVDTEIAVIIDPRSQGTIDPIPAMSVQIDWGDGSAPVTSSLPVDDSREEAIFGNHFYTQAGSYTVSISASDPSDNISLHATDSLLLTLQNLSPPPITVPPPTVSQTLAIHGVVTSFIAPAQFSPSLTTLIDWGDGSLTPGTLTDTDNLVTVDGDHQYGAGPHNPITIYFEDAQGDIVDTVTTVPEPASFALLAAGLGLLGWHRRCLTASCKA